MQRKLWVLSLIVVACIASAFSYAPNSYAAPSPQIKPQLVATLGYGVALDGAWSPDGKNFAVLAAGSIRLYDVNNLEAEPYLLPNSTGGNAITYSPDGKWIAVAGFDSIVRSWSADGSDKPRTYRGHSTSMVVADIGTRGVYALAFNHSGTILVSAGLDGQIMRWRVDDERSGTKILDIVADTVRFSPTNDSLVMVVAMDGGSVILLDLSEDKPQPITLVDGSSKDTYAQDAVFSADGEFIYALNGCQIDVYEVATTKRARIFPIYCGNSDFRPGSLEVAANDVIAVNSDQVELLNSATGEHITILQAPNPTIGNIRFSSDGRYVATIADGGVGFFEVASGKYIAPHDPFMGLTTDLAFSADGTWFASSNADGWIRIWDTAFLTIHHALRCDWADAVGYYDPHTISISPKGDLLASSDCFDGARVWNTATGELIFTTGSEDDEENVVFSDTGNYFAVQTYEKEKLGEIPSRIHIYSVDNWQIVARLRGSFSFNMFLSGTDLLLVSDSLSTENSALYLWDISTNEQGEEIVRLPFSRNDLIRDSIAIGSIDGQPQLFWATTDEIFSCAIKDCSAPRLISKLEQALITSLQLTDQGKLLVTIRDEHGEWTPILLLIDPLNGATLLRENTGFWSGNVAAALWRSRLIVADGSRLRVYNLPTN